MTDTGLAAERTALSRRRTALPFLVVALLGVRVALDAPLPGSLLAVVACGASVVAARGWGSLVTPAVVLLAAAALALPSASPGE